MKTKYLFFILGFCLISMTQCDDDNDISTKTVVESFDIKLSSSNSIPNIMDRNETGNIQMYLYSDNSLEFTITINNLVETDTLTTAHVHNGNVVSTGSVAITLVDASDIKFEENIAKGSIKLTNLEVINLYANDVYINVHSKESSSGLLRGQVNKTVDQAYNIILSPENEIPVVSDRNEDASAYFRIIGSKMYYKIIINNLADDAIITGAHIHEGSSTVNGGVFLNLDITDNDQLNIMKSISLSESELSKIKNDKLYVNIHSSDVPSGLLRGQIR